MTLVSDIIHTHQKFCLTGDKATLLTFKSVLQNPAIAKHILGKLRLPLFLAKDIFALELEEMLKKNDYESIHSKLDIVHIAQVLHVIPTGASDLQYSLYSRLLQRILQREHQTVENMRSSILALFGSLDASAAQSIIPAPLDEIEEEDLFASLFLDSQTAAPEPVQQHDPLHPTVRAAVEDSKLLSASCLHRTAWSAAWSVILFFFSYCIFM